MLDIEELVSLPGGQAVSAVGVGSGCAKAERFGKAQVLEQTDAAK